MYKQFPAWAALTLISGQTVTVRSAHETPANAWQVDVKDYAEPRALAAYFAHADTLCWWRSTYYVCRALLRDMLVPGYTRQLREMAPGFTILSDDELIERVQAEM